MANDSLHELALSVVHDSRSYQMRCANARTMSKRAYSQYLLALINECAKEQRLRFGQRFKPADITQAHADLCAYMADHVAESQDTAPGNG